MQVDEVTIATPAVIALRRGDTGKLTIWIDDVLRSRIYAMQWFGKFLRQDINTVRHATREQWSNGQAEGQIDRSKTLKRTMCGRASIELLRARLLPLQQPNSRGA